MTTAVTEFEVKALEIDPADIADRVAKAGGVHITDRHMRRYVYDTVPAVAGKWVRLRDTGSDVTLCVKEITSDQVDGTRETEVGVSDFDTAHALLTASGLTARAYQENRRSSWELDGVRLELDQWPLIPPYLEIEADTEAAVWAMADRLGLDRSGLTGENTTAVYARYGIDLTSVTDLRFTS
ncbi:CYTH domain-containing protein [Streptomyces sp. NPDC029216]|uniref:class IV adenylate cyclase n=1 Tax=Streptomyces sp. NPDC029216 TaxID=3154701 RepID=UPI003410ACA7